MASTAGKWAMGCGIGCAVVILIAVAAGYGGFVFVKKTVDEAREMGDAIRALAEQYGEISDFTPAADGAVPADRMEAFLLARELAAEKRVELDQTLTTLSAGESEGVDSPGKALGMFKAGAGMLPQMMDFISERADALFEAEMGLGEYTYIYVISYYSWLGKPPEDGPAFQMVGNEVSYSGAEDVQHVREERRRVVLETVHRHMLAMLENQRTAIEPSAALEQPWLSELEQEIAAMVEDSRRLPWQDGLPARLEASLEPYRDRLEASYSAMCNPMEAGIGFHTDRGFTVD